MLIGGVKEQDETLRLRGLEKSKAGGTCSKPELSCEDAHLLLARAWHKFAVRLASSPLIVVK